MPRSDVRDIDAIAELRRGLIRYSDQTARVLEELRLLVQRAEEYFSREQPAAWRSRRQAAEAELNEARNQLSDKRAAIRPGDRPPATEAAIRVRRAEQRLRQCAEKEQLARSLAIDIGRRCDELLGPIADVTEHCEARLPTAAAQLERLLGHLQDYAGGSPKPQSPSRRPDAGGPASH